jgi:hypothetical protein
MAAGPIHCPLLPQEVAVHFPMHPSAASGEQRHPNSSSRDHSQHPYLPSGVTPADLAGDAWWRHVPPEWRRKGSSRGQGDYVFTHAWEELQLGHPKFPLSAALLWYRSLAGEPVVIRGAQVRGVCGTTSRHTKQDGAGPKQEC